MSNKAAEMENSFIYMKCLALLSSVYFILLDVWTEYLQWIMRMAEFSLSSTEKLNWLLLYFRTLTKDPSRLQLTIPSILSCP